MNVRPSIRKMGNIRTHQSHLGTTYRIQATTKSNMVAVSLVSKRGGELSRTRKQIIFQPATMARVSQRIFRMHLFVSSPDACDGHPITCQRSRSG